MFRKASLDEVDCFKQLYAEIEANLYKLMCLMKTTGADQPYHSLPENTVPYHSLPENTLRNHVPYFFPTFNRTILKSLIESGIILLILLYFSLLMRALCETLKTFDFN